MFASRFFVLLALVVLATASRFLPHPPNFTPILAIALFSGARLGGKWTPYLVTLGAMLVSDFFLGFHSLQVLVYAFLVLVVFSGTKLSPNNSIFSATGRALGLSVVFFLVTNFFVWLTSGMYSLDTTGFVQCYTLALPFFQNSLLGDIGYTLFLFGSLALLEKTGFIGKPVPVSVRR